MSGPVEFFYSCHTDAGIRKKVNQDSCVVKTSRDESGNRLLAAVCDGVGGLSCGERASGEVIAAFAEWFDYELPQISRADAARDAILLQRWKQLVDRLNQKLFCYGKQRQIRLATTATIVLFAWGNYYVCHVGDCRLYAVGDKVEQITKDHSLVEREIDAGRLTREEAGSDHRQNVILRCIGAMPSVMPDQMIGKIQKGRVYVLCSDGFRHKIREDEIREAFFVEKPVTPAQIKQNQIALTELAKRRGETDNITVVTIRIAEENGQR